MAGIFFSYRREDSGGYARLLFNELTSKFGSGQVFMDLDSIDPGDDFGEVIHDRIPKSEVFIVLIGRNWARRPDENGGRRLDNPGDFVRREVAQALDCKIRLIPVLVGGAQFPRPEELPDELRPITCYNAHEIPERFFKESVRELAETLRPMSPSRVWFRPHTRRVATVGLTVALVALGALVVEKFRQRRQGANQPLAESLVSKPPVPKPEEPGKTDSPPPLEKAQPRQYPAAGAETPLQPQQMAEVKTQSTAEPALAMVRIPAGHSTWAVRREIGRALPMRRKGKACLWHLSGSESI